MLLMNIAWHNFTPLAALVGGLLIGLSSALFVLGVGRVAGIAGIVAVPWRALWARGRRLPTLRAHRSQVAFIAGLLLAPWAWQIWAPLPAASVDVGNTGLVLAGLLVGVGVRMGNGCTSGHGVCGLSRFSKRSLANVLAFMVAGFVTVALLRHLL